MVLVTEEARDLEQHLAVGDAPEPPGDADSPSSRMRPAAIIRRTAVNSASNDTANSALVAGIAGDGQVGVIAVQ